MNCNRIKNIIIGNGCSVNINIKNLITNSETVLKSSAVIQAITSKNKTYFEYVPSGFLSGDYFVYLGLPEARIDLYSVHQILVSCDESEEQYLVKTAQPAIFMNKVLYVRAVLEKYVATP